MPISIKQDERCWSFLDPRTKFTRSEVIEEDMKKNLSNTLFTTPKLSMPILDKCTASDEAFHVIWVWLRTGFFYGTAPVIKALVISGIILTWNGWRKKLSRGKRLILKDIRDSNRKLIAMTILYGMRWRRLQSAYKTAFWTFHAIQPNSFIKHEKSRVMWDLYNRKWGFCSHCSFVTRFCIISSISLESIDFQQILSPWYIEICK